MRRAAEPRCAREDARRPAARFASPRFWRALCAALLLLGVLGSVFVLRAPRGEWVTISQEGAVLHRIHLRRTEDRTITVTCPDGYNVIEIKDHEIRVIEASCPDKTCVHMGALARGGLPIVCLPNRLVIQFSAEDDYADATAG